MIGKLEFLDSETVRINVYLRDGSKFIDKRIPDQPTGEYERVVSFWDGDVLNVYPLDLVQRYEFTVESLKKRIRFYWQNITVCNLLCPEK